MENSSSREVIPFRRRHPGRNKNAAALPILAAALLSDGDVTLHNMPIIGDVRPCCNCWASRGGLGADRGHDRQTVRARTFVPHAPLRAVPAHPGGHPAGRAAAGRFGRAVVPLPRRRPDRPAPSGYAPAGAGRVGRRYRLQPLRLHMTTSGLRGADILLDEMSVHGD